MRKLPRWSLIWGGVWLLTAGLWFSLRRSTVDPAEVAFDRWLLLGMLALLHVPSFYRSLHEYCRVLSQSDNGRCRRLGLPDVLAAVPHYFLPIPVLILTHGRLWTATEIGFVADQPWVWIMFAGLITVIPYRTLSMIFEQVLPRELPAVQARLNRQSIDGAFPRGVRARVLTALIRSLAGPVYEDVIAHGFLVYLLGETCGSRTVGIAVGLWIFVLGHLYQGWRSCSLLLIFFAFNIVLLYSPFGLLGSISLHIFNNAFATWYTFRHGPAYVLHLRALCREPEVPGNS